MLYNYGLKRADVIAVQGIKQQELLRQNYNIASFPVNMSAEESSNPNLHKKNIDILWVANIRQAKRPGILLELASTLPEYNFTIIGDPVPGDEAYFNNVRKRANEIPNINFKGFIPYSEVNDYFEQSQLLVKERCSGRSIIVVFSILLKASGNTR